MLRGIATEARKVSHREKGRKRKTALVMPTKEASIRERGILCKGEISRAEL